MNLIVHLWIRWPSVELSQIISWIGLTSLINWVKIPQFCQPYLLMLIGNRLVKLNGPAASGRNHIFKICMLSFVFHELPSGNQKWQWTLTSDYPFALELTCFFRISGFPGHLYTNSLCILFGLYNDIQFYDNNNTYIYIFVYIISYTVLLLLYIYIFVHTTLHMLCTYIDIWNMVDPPLFQPSLRCLKALRSFRRTPAAARPNMVMF